MQAPGDLITVDVEGLDPAGDGMTCGTVGGRRVHLDAAIPGEQVEARVVAGTGNDLLGEVVRVVRASAHRVAPRCPFFGPCGGCTWQHIAYAEQLRLKQRMLQALLKEALGAAAPVVRPALAGDGGEWGFRNKVHFVFGRAGPSTRRTVERRGSLGAGGLVIGHYRRGSQSVIEVDQCPVHADEGNRVAFAMRDALARAGVDGATADGRRGIARHLVVRVAEPARANSPAIQTARANGVGRWGPTSERAWRGAGEPAVQTMLTLVVTRNDRRLKQAVAAILGGARAKGASAQPPGANNELPPAIRRLRTANRELPTANCRPPTGLALNINDKPGPYLFGEETHHLHGPRRVREEVAGLSFLVSPIAFFQTNVRAAETMVQVVLEQADGAQTVLDLYAGAGLFALPLAARGARVVAVEENREAIEDGDASRRLNRIAESSCTFVRARAEDVASGRRRRAIPGSPDLIVLDPPRAGCPRRVLEWVCRSLHPRRVIYVSCNPQALVRDLAVPLAAGYTLRVVQPIDMFPHTSHIETVAVFTG